jgi:hypothetical protein
MAAEQNPSQALPAQPETPGARQHEPNDGGYDFFLRDGITPYRRLRGTVNFEVWGGQIDDGWMLQNLIDPDRLWEATPNEIAGIVGDAKRLAEPRKGIVPYIGDEDSETLAIHADLAEASFRTWPEDDPEIGGLTEADSTADLPQPDAGAPPDGELESNMTEQEIRDAGMQIDLPFESAGPEWLTYSDTGQQAWVPPSDWRAGMPPIDPLVAERLGVPPDLGQEPSKESDGSSGT